jgi:YgiT-type zinc finger domain-containing protein
MGRQLPDKKGDIMSDMGRCHTCGGTRFEKRNVLRLIHYQAHTYLFKNVPAMVCAQCGQEYFSAQTHDNIMMLLRDKTPTHTETLDAYDLTGLEEKTP